MKGCQPVKVIASSGETRPLAWTESRLTLQLLAVRLVYCVSSAVAEVADPVTISMGDCLVPVEHVPVQEVAG
jgi:hypothetical protein